MLLDNWNTMKSVFLYPLSLHCMLLEQFLDFQRYLCFYIVVYVKLVSDISFFFIAWMLLECDLFWPIQSFCEGTL